MRSSFWQRKDAGFVVLIIVIRQIEENLIYPKVMGKRVGLSFLWMLVAITLDSGVAGVWGMLPCSCRSLPPPISCSAMFCFTRPQRARQSASPDA